MNISSDENMNIAWISKIEWDMPHKTSRVKLSESLRKRGHDVTLYMARKFGEKQSISDNIIGIPTVHYPILSGIFFGLIVFFFFPVLLKKKKVDIIVIDFTKIWLPFVLSLKILNKPIVLDIRTLPIDKEIPFSFKLLLYLSRYIADGITTITPELKKILVDDFNLSEIKIGVWCSGVSIDDFNSGSAPKINVLQNNSENDKFILMYHGDYSPTRGIENLVTAMNNLESSLKDKIKLYIIGMPENRLKDLEKLSHDVGVHNQVELIPKVSYTKMISYLFFADAGVIPLPPENSWWQVSAPLKTLEYLAACKPIIATNIPLHCRIFEKGNCGILINSGSPSVIAQGITRLYMMRNELEKMGYVGRNIVETYYTWEIMAKEFEDFLKKIAI